MKKLKVFSVNINGRDEVIIATTSKAQAVKLLGVSPSCMRDYGHEVRNEEVIKVAMEEPGVPLKRPFSSNEAEWKNLAWYERVMDTAEERLWRSLSEAEREAKAELEAMEAKAKREARAKAVAVA